MTTLTQNPKKSIVNKYTINFVWININTRRKKKNITETLKKYIIKWTWKKENLSGLVDKTLYGK
jgi:hypothetical protein